MLFAMNTDRLLEIFYKLVSISAVSREERPVADFIRTFLSANGIDAHEDGAGKKVGGNTGNLIAAVKGNLDLPAIGFTAHMDTVKPTKGIKPCLKDGKITSDGTTILGADNRAGIAIILFTIEQLRESGTEHRPFEVIFSIGEETGLFGALHLDKDLINSKDLYILDSSADPGGFVSEAPHALEFQAEIVGKSSHAAVQPDEGINAIAMAGELVGSVPLGQVDEQTTINFGTIHGGEANNVIPPLVQLTGEIRSFDKTRIDRYYQDLLDNAAAIAGKFEGECRISSHEAFPGFNLDLDSVAVQRLGWAMKELNMPFKPLRYHGGSDANILNGRGFTAIDLGIGAKNPHSTSEYIMLSDMQRMVHLVNHLVTKSEE
jgi:tripeptide aminopeptidase